MGKFTGHSITSDSALGSAVIQRSLRFNRADAPYLQTTLGNSNVDKWTWSGWVKKTLNGQHQNLFSSGSDSVVTMINFDNNDYLKFQNWHSGQRGTKITNRKCRDLTGWLHIVAIWDSGNSTADDRIRLYVNGTRETDFSSSSNPDQNQDSVINGNTLGGSDYGEGKHFIGRYADLTDPSGTYKTEIHFIDGQAYDPSYFGFTDPVTGIWMPKRYEGVYGSNGFYLDFSDNSSTTTLGIDKSPNGNDFTANNFSVSAGTGNDSLEDTPTNNFCTLNALHKDSNTTLSEGNLKAVGSTSTEYNTNTQGTFAQSSGKWYYEVEYTSNAGGTNSNLLAVGWARTTLRFSDNPTSSGGLCYRPANGDYIDIDGSDTSNDKPQTSTGNVIQVAIDLDAGKIWFGNGGTFFESGNPATGANATITFTGGSETLSPFVRTLSSTLNFNFGQRAFSYTVPTGYKTLESRNLPPTTPSITKPQRHFDNIIYDGDGSASKDITGLQFKPDLVWIKNRTQSATHSWQDSVIGFGDDKTLRPDTSNQLDTNGNLYGYINHTLPNGFNVNGGSDHGSSRVNSSDSGAKHVAWCWKAGGSSSTFNIDGKGYTTAAAAGLDGGSLDPTGASINTEAGFAILTYTGTNSVSETIAHGLGKKPAWIMVKALNIDGQDWVMYHKELDGGNQPATHILRLNVDTTEADVNDVWQDTEPTSSVFTIGTEAMVNHQAGHLYVAYCWSEIPGYSKFGKYEANGDSNGPYVHCGFRPAWVMIKNTSLAQPWVLMDNKINPHNLADTRICPSSNSGDHTSGDNYIDFLADGFKVRSGSSTDINYSTSYPNHKFMAFAEEPGTTPFDTFPNAR